MLVKKLLEPKLDSQPKRPLLQQVQTPTAPFCVYSDLGSTTCEGCQHSVMLIKPVDHQVSWANMRKKAPWPWEGERQEHFDSRIDMPECRDGLTCLDIDNC